MSKKTLIIASMIMVGLFSIPSRGEYLWAINPANGHWYTLTNGYKNWTDSEMEAVAAGGHLATIRNQKEQEWVENFFSNFGGVQRLLWIGLNDVSAEGHFVWTSEEPVNYTHWDEGEPNNAGGGEDYVAMFYPGHHAHGYWNDWPNISSDSIGVPFNGVIEVVPEPISFSLVAIGGVVLALRRKPGRIRRA